MAEIKFEKEDKHFSKTVRKELLLRSGLRCSNPKCKRLTAAYCKEQDKIIVIGEAAHIHSRSEHGERFDENVASYEIENGLWLCPSCHTLIDKKGMASIFTAELLEQWKAEAENGSFNLLSDPHEDFLQCCKLDYLDKTTFNFKTASDMQILLILYCLYNDEIIDYSFVFDEEYGYCGFKEFYEKFYDFIKSEDGKRFKSKLNTIKFKPSSEFNVDYKLFTFYLNYFTSHLLDDNFENFVEVKNGSLKLANSVLVTKLFNNEYEKVDEFVEYWKK